MRSLERYTMAMFLSLSAVVGSGCGPGDTKISRQPFGDTQDGKSVELFTLRNKNRMEAKITNYGGIVVSLLVPDRNGNMGDVVLGYDRLDNYITDNPYFGALIGRYGNRISKGRFTLDGVDYRLAVNDGENHLHGGLKGFDKVVWDAAEAESSEGPALHLKYVSPDGEEGYPGTLLVDVIYTLTDSNELKIEYSAVSDRPTVANLTHHSYFNLAGEGSGTILDHVLTIEADLFTPVGPGLIPTGELRSVEGTPLDFRKPTRIGERIDAGDEQMKLGGGYDHNWVLNKSTNALMQAARVEDRSTGRVMEVLTTEPALQFYSGNFLTGKNVGKKGHPYVYRSGFCLETQHYPDSPNRREFPSTLLDAGKKYSSTTVYRFFHE
jgi:aldose 1-epimerase